MAMVSEAIALDKIYGIGDNVKSKLGRVLEVESMDDGIRIRRRDGDKVLDASIYVTENEYNGERYTAIGVNGASNKENGYACVTASVIPNSEFEARSILRFAIACTFNLDIGFEF